MLIYLFLLFFLLVAGFLLKNKPLGNIAIFFLFCISMFRDKEVGLDTIEYVEPSYYARRTELTTGFGRFEFSNNVIENLIPYFGNHTGIWIYSIILFVFVVLACKRFKINLAYAFFFFVLLNYFNISLNISRQFAAIAIILYSYSFLTEDNIKKYLFFPLVILAASFHITSIVIIPLFFIRMINLSKVNPLVLAAVVVGIYCTMQTIGRVLIEWANMYSLSLTDDTQGWSEYFDQAKENDHSIVGLMLGIISYIIDIFILIRISRVTDKRAQLISLIFIIGIFLSMLFNNVYGNLGRMKYFFEIINIFAFSYYCMHDKSKNKPAIAFMIMAFYGIVYLWNLTATDAYGTIPYGFMF